MIRRICTFPCCDEFAEKGEARCEDHLAARRKQNTERWKRVQSDPRIAAFRRLYDAKWNRASKRFLQRYPTCCHCAEVGLVTAATEVDHIVPHRGDRKLFWDGTNWQALCKPCHSRKTASETLNRRR